jgi:hypothetical protein
MAVSNQFHRHNTPLALIEARHGLFVITSSNNTEPG